jgi:hypothetical protein
MKKASKMAGLLLPLVMAMIMLGGCPTDGDDDETEKGPIEFNSKVNPTESSTTFKTYYIQAVDTAKPAPYNDISELARLHFHLPKGSGFKLKEIFISASATETGKTVLFDFTSGTTIDACTKSPAYSSTVSTGTLTGHFWQLDNSSGLGEVYPGNLGFGLGNAAYVGFVIANISDTVTFDNLQIEFMKAGDVSYQSKPAAWYFGFAKQPAAEEPGPGPQEPDLDLTTWTPFYLDLSNTSPEVERFHIHSEKAFVEIQQILVNNTKSLTGATSVVDFRQAASSWTIYDSTFTNTDPIKGIKEGGTTNGRWEYNNTDTGYEYGGNFGSGASKDSGKKIWIFVVRTNTSDKAGLGDFRVAPHNGTELGVVKFIEMEN